VIRCGWAGALPRRLVLVAAAALIPVLAGCEAGNNAPTLEFHYPTDTAGTVVGNLSIRNVFVLGAVLGSSLHPGQNASVFLALVNNGAPDRLVSISAPGSASSVVLPAGGVPVLYQRPAFLSGPTPAIYLKDLTRPLANGTDVTLVLNFAKLGPVSLEVPVMPRATHFATYAPPPSSAATAKPHGKTASPSPSPSGTS
jgi:copper(I)-binding protein